VSSARTYAYHLHKLLQHICVIVRISAIPSRARIALVHQFIIPNTYITYCTRYPVTPLPVACPPNQVLVYTPSSWIYCRVSLHLEAPTCSRMQPRWSATYTQRTYGSDARRILIPNDIYSCVFDALPRTQSIHSASAWSPDDCRFQHVRYRSRPISKIQCQFNNVHDTI